MIDLLIHPKNTNDLSAFFKKPSHAVLIVGSAGTGKLTLAKYLAEKLLKLGNGKIDSYGYAKIISSIDNKAIGIDEIRELDGFLSLKVPHSADINRVVVIGDSHLLTLEAQNALLKILEEPPRGTVMILTSAHSELLLPTIRSRTQIIYLNKPNKQQIDNYFADRNFENTKIDKAYAISGGSAGLMSSLLNNLDHPLTDATVMARKLLSQSAYERLLSVDTLAKNKALAIDVTFIFKQMAHVSLLRATGKSAKRWQAVLKASYEAGENLNNNTSAKLNLTKLMLNL